MLRVGSHHNSHGQRVARVVPQPRMGECVRIPCPCILELTKKQQFIIGRIPTVHDVQRASWIVPIASQPVSHLLRSVVSSDVAEEGRGHPRPPQCGATIPWRGGLAVHECLVDWGLPSGGVPCETLGGKDTVWS